MKTASASAAALFLMALSACGQAAPTEQCALSGQGLASSASPTMPSLSTYAVVESIVAPRQGDPGPIRIVSDNPGVATVCAGLCDLATGTFAAEIQITPQEQENGLLIYTVRVDYSGAGAASLTETGPGYCRTTLIKIS